MVSANDKPKCCRIVLNMLRARDGRQEYQTSSSSVEATETTLKDVGVLDTLVSSWYPMLINRSSLPIAKLCRSTIMNIWYAISVYFRFPKETPTWRFVCKHLFLSGWISLSTPEERIHFSVVVVNLRLSGYYHYPNTEGNSEQSWDDWINPKFKLLALRNMFWATKAWSLTSCHCKQISLKHWIFCSWTPVGLEDYILTSFTPSADITFGGKEFSPRLSALATFWTPL